MPCSVTKNIRVMKECKKTRPPKVTDGKKGFFFDTIKDAVFKNLTTPVDNGGEKFYWNLIQEFMYEKVLFGFQFIYDLNGK